VLDEGVLRRCIGSAKVMHDQLVRLAEMAGRPMIKVHVIPAEVGAHIGLLGAFAIAGFAGDAPGIVYFESPDEGETSRDSATVAKIILTFDTLRSEALPRGAWGMFSCASGLTERTRQRLSRRGVLTLSGAILRITRPCGPTGGA
jgi:hypothetical protein